MIRYVQGNLLESTAQALVNAVNIVGVMGKGIALQFKNHFPENYKHYVDACKDGSIDIGKSFVVEERGKLIINLPTKKHWKNPSEYAYVEKGLADLVRIINEKRIHSIAIPALGVGNGGLDWNKVKDLLELYLANLDANVFIYEPL